MDNLPDKAQLRQKMLAVRRALPSDVKDQADAQIARRLSQWLADHQVKVLGGYLPIAGEPDLTSFYAELPTRGITLALPVVLEKHRPLVFVRWRPGDALSRDASGTMGPAARGDYLQPDAVLAPCIGFTEANLRLGFGGGYFDRTLAQSPRPKAVGIAYQFSKVSFPAEAHDVALDVIITD